jgi:hypothetical protein
MFAAVMLFQKGYISGDSLNYLATTIFSLLLPFLALSYMFLKGKSLDEIVSSLGLNRERLSLFMIVIGVILFLQLFALEIIVTLLSTIINVQINTNVATVFQTAPLWFIVFTSIIGPIDEEVFFRGFLVPRLGIFLSAAFFAILHAGYNSTFGIEIIAAFIFGSLAGYVFKKTKSLYPSIVAHILVNSLTLLAGVIFLRML